MNALIVFVKAPVPGRVKTRLQPPLSGAQAARLYEAFVGDAVASARLCGEAAVEVAYEPHPKRPDLSWLEEAPAWFPQTQGDLGARLIAAFERAFSAGAGKVVVIGSDCPDLEPDILRQAFERLDDAPAVIGPAEDGGYYLIGLSRAMPHLFTKMEWSVGGVLRDTVDRLRLRGDGFRLLPTRRDVDGFADLKSLFNRLQTGESTAPRSREAIRGLIIEDMLNMFVERGLRPNEKGGRP